MHAKWNENIRIIGLAVLDKLQNKQTNKQTNRQAHRHSIAAIKEEYIIDEIHSIRL